MSNKRLVPKPRPVLISYCCPDILMSDFCFSLANMVSFSSAQGLHIGVHDQRTTLVEVGRTYQLAKALAWNCSHVLILDSDMSFPRDTLVRLLARNKDIVGCTYSQRRTPRAYTHESLQGDFSLPSDPREEVFEVRSLGFGCILIRAEVFRDMPRPWFRIEYSGNIMADGGDGHRSEDRTFCDRARERGFKVWCDLELSRQVKHVGTFAFGLEHVEVLPTYHSF